MKTKLVQKEAEVKGVGSFDENGKMLIPTKLSNGETTLVTQDALKQILNLKDKKQKVKKEKVPKAKAIVDPTIRKDFALRVVSEVKGTSINEIEDRLFIKFGNHTITRLMNRTNGVFCAYRKIDGERATMRVSNKNEQQELLEWIASRVEELRLKAPKTKVKKSNKPKDKKHSKRTTTIDKLNDAEAKALAGHGNGFALGKIKKSPEVVKWCESKGYTLNSTSVKF